MDPVEAIVEIFEGEPMEYPFDKHEAELSFYFEPAGAATDADKSIPVAIQLYGSVSGLKIEADYAQEHADDHVVIELNLSPRADDDFLLRVHHGRHVVAHPGRDLPGLSGPGWPP